MKVKDLKEWLAEIPDDTDIFIFAVRKDGEFYQDQWYSAFDPVKYDHNKKELTIGGVDGDDF